MLVVPTTSVRMWRHSSQEKLGPVPASINDDLAYEEGELIS
jgi:hypothetical protein